MENSTAELEPDRIGAVPLDMIRRRDLKPLSLVAGSAVAAGLAFGLWLALPSYLATPVVRTEPQLRSAIDPNLAKYRRTVEAAGVNTTPYVLSAGYYPVAPAIELPSRSRPGDVGLEAEYDGERADFDAGEREAEIERVAWLEERRAAWRAETRGYRGAYREGDEDEAEHWRAEPSRAHQGWSEEDGPGEVVWAPEPARRVQLRRYREPDEETGFEPDFEQPTYWPPSR